MPKMPTHYKRFLKDNPQLTTKNKCLFCGRAKHRGKCKELK